MIADIPAQVCTLLERRRADRRFTRLYLNLKVSDRRTLRASSGQILILMAGALIALVGMIGLVTDLGYDYAQRRTMQNAADAGALAGAHALSKSTGVGSASVLAEVRSAVQANALGGSTPSITSCIYVDDSDKSLGNCSIVIPDKATGVHVVVKETHNTFFIQAVPGGPDTMSTNASATAHVQLLKTPPTDGPFLVCGVSTKIDASGNQSINILQQSGGQWTLNSAAVTTSSHTGPKLVIYGPQVSQCGLGSNSYKGLALGGTNKSLTVPGWFFYTTGDTAGQLSANVAGVQGCTQTQIVNCVAFLPVSVNNPAGDKTNLRLWTVMILPFYITGTPNGQGNYNTLDGQIIGDYITEGSGQTGWTPGTYDPVVIRLTK